MKIRIFFFLLSIFTKTLVFAQVNPPTQGEGLVEFYQKCPVYENINGKVIGHLNRHGSIFLKFNNGDSINIEDCLEMSCCDSYPELLFFKKKGDFVNIARSSNNGKGFWLRENNNKDSSITSIPWKTMILDTVRHPDEFYFMSKKDSIQLFKKSSSKSSFETLNNNGNWYINLTGNVKGNWIEVIAIEKKFEPCYEYDNYEDDDEKQQDIRTKKGYLHCLDNLGLPIIWFLICEM